MKNLYNKYFYVPKHGKISDKVMLVRVACSLAVMIACLLAMSITAYAYFSSSVTSGGNVISSANYDLDIKIVGAAIDGSEINHTAETPNKYEVKIALGEENTATTGFCIVKIEQDGKETEYYTAQIGADEKAPNKERPELTFYLEIDTPCKVTFISHWGTSAYYDGYNDSERYIDEKNVLKITQDV